MKNGQRKSWKIACMALALAVTAIVLAVVLTPEKNIPNMDLTKEIAQKDKVLTYFLHSDDAILVEARKDSAKLDAATLEKLLAPYIPEGARGSSLLITEHVVYLDYFMDEVCYTVSYYDTGLVKKTARGVNDTVIYTSRSDIESFTATNVGSI